MKILVLQIEDRNDPLLNKFMKSNEIICKNNDMEYIFLKKSAELVPPYWAKVFEIKKIMEEKKDFDYILWVDSDAFFINFTKQRFSEFLEKYKEYSFIGTPDMPPWTGQFNAGVFIIKNTEIGKEMVNKWITYYHTNVWNYNKKTDKWKTDAVWAGDEYEQGSFSTYMLKDSKFSKHIKIIPYYYLNNHTCGDHQEDTLLVHLAGNYKKDQKNVDTCIPKLTTSKTSTTTQDNIIEKFENFQESKSVKILSTILYILIIIFIILLIIIIYTKCSSSKLQISKISKISKNTIKK